MKIEELVEYKIHKIEDIIVFQNPNKEQLLNLLSQYGNAVRGIVIEKDIYIWKAYDAVHMKIISVFQNQGLSIHDIYTFTIILSDVRNFNIELDDTDNKKISSHRAFRRMTRDLTIKEWD